MALLSKMYLEIKGCNIHIAPVLHNKLFVKPVSHFKIARQVVKNT